MKDMKHRKKIQAAVLSLLAALSVAACEDGGRQESPFNPEVGHPASWVSDHGDAALSKGSSCPDCHGPDLRGGVSQLSCFIANFQGVGCHESGAGTRHTAGWDLPSEHGRIAKDGAGISSGMAFCQACHGRDYRGGTSEVPCHSCHGVPAPHPAAPWTEGRYTHHDVNEENAVVCSDCHEKTGAVEPPGCFSGSLCHGERNVHPDGWQLAGEHGAQAKAGLGDGGLEECQGCHGRDFEGGTTGVSCFSCHQIEAPHPQRGWAEGGAGHRSAAEENAPVCALCHSELSSPPDCFTANDCHGSAPALGDTPPPDEETVPEGEPPSNGGEIGEEPAPAQ